ncbi:hypothetical protein [[Mycobacterium] wendilense]|uniref:Uncharacterized protein n=1 Tax=[Mycobacterium] wendilense TaxID=3064284 RepID=A0ABM9MDF4_9MYCO|nr:hypothetical protein [Mycolicibacterium sp. MU0050]CAJ1582528.1 hypothetical protein MU0050_002144 [Mycolicibacterium sp. MU0050]
MLTGNTSAPAVVVFGRQNELLDVVLEEFRRRGDVAIYGGALTVSPEEAGSTDERSRRIDLEQLRANTDSVLVIIDDEMLESILREDHSRRSRKMLRTEEDQIAEFVTDSVVSADPDRLLVLGDARGATPAERPQAVRWVRQLTARIGYECSINGTDDFATTYEVLGPDDDVARTARSIAQWHDGRLGRQPDRPPALSGA